MSTLISLNIQISELEKEIASESACAAAMHARADEIDAKVQVLKGGLASLIATRDALPTDPEAV